MTDFQTTIRRLFFENFLLKIGSFILAVVLWFFVQNQGKIEQKVTYKITSAVLKNLPQDGVFRLFQRSADSVAVNMRGLPSLMSGIEKNTSFQIRFADDFDDWGKEIVFPLDNTTVQNLPPGVEITSIEPASLTMMIDYVAEKEVPVSSNIIGFPMEGYRVTKISIVPQKILIRGPRTTVSQCEQVLTEQINIDRANSDYRERNVAIMLPDKYSQSRPRYVEVHFEIQEIIDTITFEKIPFKEIKILEGTTYELKSETVDITVTGPILLLNTLQSDNIIVSLDLQSLPADKWREVRPKVLLPAVMADRVKVSAVKPAQIKARVTKIKEK